MRKSTILGFCIWTLLHSYALLYSSAYKEYESLSAFGPGEVNGGKGYSEVEKFCGLFFDESHYGAIEFIVSVFSLWLIYLFYRYNRKDNSTSEAIGIPIMVWVFNAIFILILFVRVSIERQKIEY
jgi:hypothetical protein